MKIKKVIEQDLPTLVELARSTFVAAFEQDNDPIEFAAYIRDFFTLDVFKKEFYTEGSVFYLVYDKKALIGYFKLNRGKIPHDAVNVVENVVGNFSCRLPNDDNAATKVADYIPDKLTELERFYLIPETHGKGFATLMMQHAEVLTAKNKSTYLWLGVWEHNLKARKFYEKTGFSKFAEHIFWAGTDPQTDWLMWKKM
jgi:diamine N-acetyltransferase